MDNVDSQEIAKFDALSETWWDENGDSQALHDINQCRGEFICRTPIEGKRVLDIGCGGGLLTEFLARAGASVVGIDASAPIIEVARQHARSSGLEIDYRVSTVEAFLADNNTKFDVVTCMEMLEHVPDPASVVAAAASCLKNQGLAYFSTINRTPKAYAFGVVAAEYILKLLPIGTHEFKHFIRPSELAAWCRACGLEQLEARGIHYAPFIRRAKLVRNLDVNYIVETRLNTA